MARSVLIAKPTYDIPVDNFDFKDFKFYVLEGNCKKCKAKETSLVMFDFILNTKDKNQSIFRTLCLCCNHKDMYFSKDVKIENTVTPINDGLNDDSNTGK